MVAIQTLVVALLAAGATALSHQQSPSIAHRHVALAAHGVAKRADMSINPALPKRAGNMKKRLAKQRRCKPKAQAINATPSATPKPAAPAKNDSKDDDNKDDDNKPSPTPKPAPSPTKKDDDDPKPTKKDDDPKPPKKDDDDDNDGGNSGGQVYKGGQATFFDQNGVAGACGKPHPDSYFLVAMDYRRYGNLNAVSSWCGKRLRITNLKNGRSAIAEVADACPTCNNENSLDMSRGLFMNGLGGTVDEGVFPIAWSVV